MVVGIRQTSSAISTVTVTDVPANTANGCRETTANMKMIVRPASRMLSAISFGVFCRDADSTSPMILSRKVSPGFWVISTTMRSDSTRVPPVTALRSPPASRMTGADSPVIAELVDRRDALDDGAVAGDDVARLAHDDVALAQLGRRHRLLAAVDDAARDGVGARLAQRRRLRLAAPLGDRLGEVGEEHGEPQPQRDLEDEAAVGVVGEEPGDPGVGGHHRADARPRT